MKKKRLRSKTRKKKRGSRALRKIRSLVQNQGNYNFSEETKKVYATDNKKVVQDKKPAIKEKVEEKSFVSDDTKLKTKEIYSHLRQVIATSIVCLLILGGLFYFDRKSNLIDSLTSKIMDFGTNWDWNI